MNYRYFSKDEYEILKPFVTLDPLFLPLLVNMCSVEDLPMVFSVIPTYLSAARLLKYVKDVKRYYTFDEVRYAGVCILCML